MPRSSRALRPKASGPSAQARKRSISCCRAPPASTPCASSCKRQSSSGGELRRSRPDVRAPPRERRGAAATSRASCAHVGSPRDRATERATRDRRDRDRARRGDRSDRCQRERRRRAARASRARAAPARARSRAAARRARPRARRRGHARRRECQRRRTAGTRSTSGSGVAPRESGPHEDGRGDEERRQPQPRDERRAAPFSLAVRGVARGVLRVRNRCGRHAACSMPAGFVAGKVQTPVVEREGRRVSVRLDRRACRETTRRSDSGRRVR